MDYSHAKPTVRLSALLGAALVSLLLVACNGDDGLLTPTAGGDGSTPTALATATTASPTTSPTPEPTQTVEPGERLRSLLLSVISTGETSDDQAALAQMEVVAVDLEDADRDLWAAVSSGPGVWELEDEARHVVAVYERRPDDSWVEVAVLPLESEPTIADLEVVPTDAPEGVTWLAVHGFTGAHGGTFELVRFDGAALASALWWFSPSPGAATLADLDDDGQAEIVLDASDPYVYCYACNVTAWAEIIYRWVDGEPVAVNIAPVETAGDRVRELTEQATRYVEADLWRRARSTMQLAAEAAPEDDEVWWLRLAVERTAQARLADAGAPQQPLTTAVLAGEYDVAVDLMRPLDPAEVYDPEGPLVAGTVAEGWHDSMGTHLIDYADRALGVDPMLASAYAVRSVGRVMVDPDDWAGALLDMEAALALAPDDAFFRDAHAFLLARTGGTGG